MPTIAVSRRCSPFARSLLAALSACLLSASGAGAADAAPEPVKIAVFMFELDDFSAAASTGAAPDTSSSLVQSTKEAERLLTASGRYTVIDAANLPTKVKDLRDCGACDAPLAAKLGADQALLGVITKVSMTEFRVQIQVRDAHSDRVLATYRTDLRIGAYYAWWRGVRSLIQNQMLSGNPNDQPSQQQHQ